LESNNVDGTPIAQDQSLVAIENYHRQW
jgi:hypothetical protein